LAIFLFFKQNLDQDMPKNAYFLVKRCKIAAASGAPSPNPPLATISFFILQESRTRKSSKNLIVFFKLLFIY